MTTAEKKITCKNYDSALLGAHISGKNKESMEISIKMLKGQTISPYRKSIQNN